MQVLLRGSGIHVSLLHASFMNSDKIYIRHKNAFIKFNVKYTFY